MLPCISERFSGRLRAEFGTVVGVENPDETGSIFDNEAIERDRSHSRRPSDGAAFYGTDHITGKP